MAHRHLLAARHGFHPRVREGRHDHHDRAQQDRADNRRARSGHADRHQDHGQHRGHVEDVVAGEEDVVQVRGARDDQAGQESQEHQPCGQRAVLGLCQCHDGLVGGHHPARPGGPEDEFAQRFESVDDGAGAGDKDQEPHRCFDGPADHLAGGTAQRDEADGRHEADQVERFAEDFIDEEFDDCK